MRPSLTCTPSARCPVTNPLPLWVRRCASRCGAAGLQGAKRCWLTALPVAVSRLKPGPPCGMQPANQRNRTGGCCNSCRAFKCAHALAVDAHRRVHALHGRALRHGELPPPPDRRCHTNGGGGGGAAAPALPALQAQMRPLELVACQRSGVLKSIGSPRLSSRSLTAEGGRCHMTEIPLSLHPFSPPSLWRQSGAPRGPQHHRPLRGRSTSRRPIAEACSSCAMLSTLRHAPEAAACAAASRRKVGAARLPAPTRPAPSRRLAARAAAPSGPSTAPQVGLDDRRRPARSAVLISRPALSRPSCRPPLQKCKAAPRRICGAPCRFCLHLRQPRALTPPACPCAGPRGHKRAGQARARGHRQARRSRTRRRQDARRGAGLGLGRRELHQEPGC